MKNLFKIFSIVCVAIISVSVTSVTAVSAQEDVSKKEDSIECGPANGDYWADDEDYRGDYCSKSEPSSTPGFPMPGEGVEWQCTTSGTASSDCRAYRSILTEEEHLGNLEEMKQSQPPKEETKMDRLIKNIKQTAADFKRGLEVIGDALWPF